MGNNKRYFWFKLYDDFFASKRIKKLRKLAGGDTFTIIYLKMQLKALKTDGYLYFDGYMGNFYEELALDLDEEPENVNITIQYLLSVGLLEVSEDGKQYYLSYLNNCIGSETASAQRVRDFRQRQKEQQKALQCNTDVTKALHCNTAVTDVLHDCSAEKEKEKEKEKEYKKQDNISGINMPDCSTELNDVVKSTTKQFQEITTIWNSLTAYGLTPIRGINKDSLRAKQLRARLREYGKDSFAEIVEQIKASDFLQGRTGTRPWQVTFDWVIKPANYAKVLEGTYKNSDRQQAQGKAKNFIDIPSSYAGIDMAEFESQMIDN